MKLFENLVPICDIARIISVSLLLLQYVLILDLNPRIVYQSVAYYAIFTSYIVLFFIIFSSNLMLWSITVNIWKAILKYPNNNSSIIIPPRITLALVFSIIVPLYTYLDISTNFLIILQIIHAEAVKYIYWILLAILVITNIFNTTSKYIDFLLEELIKLDKERRRQTGHES